MIISESCVPFLSKINCLCLKDYSNNNAFKLKNMEDGIISVSNLFKNTDFKLVFLADRWFGSSKILNIIDHLKHTYLFD